MYTSAPAWFVICDEHAPMDGWRCLLHPTFHRPLLLAVERRAGRGELRVHLPPNADEFFFATEPGGRRRWLRPSADEVAPLPHSCFSRGISLEDVPSPLVFPDLPHETARDGMLVTTQLWRGADVHTVSANPPGGAHRALAERLLELALQLGESEVVRRVGDIRSYLHCQPQPAG